MIVTCVSVQVKPEHIENFIRASVENGRNSVREPGNLRFDVLQCADDPTRFTLYEAYDSEEAAAAHKSTPHYLTWKQTVETWMARPRTGVKHRVLYPDDREQW